MAVTRIMIYTTFIAG